MIQKRIIIKNRVQEVGYRVFLTDIAFEIGIEYFNARNIDGEKVEVLVGGKKENIERFVDMVKREKPAIAENPNIISEDDYDKEIPLIDTYYKRLAMQQFSKGIDAIYRLGDRVEKSLSKI
jgi:acylphosphatase